jgi:hypothetical protein
MSEDEPQERPRIKVTDRRLFDREGNARPESDDAEKAPPAGTGSAATTTSEPPGIETAAPSAAPPADGTPSASSTADRSEPSGDRVPDEAIRAAMDQDSQHTELDPTERSATDLPRDLGAFIESQYYECLLFLGAMRHPATGQTVEDLDMARYKIDLLDMLQVKTAGNRTPEESAMLDDVLYQLRMAYLQKRKVPKL